MKDSPLNIEIKDDKLVISIGVETLTQAVEKEWGNSQIVNRDNFIKHITEAIIEEKNGDSPITTMITNAAERSKILNKAETKDINQWWVLLLKEPNG